MAETISKYLLGICYTYQKYLYCFKPLLRRSCKCDKSKKPVKISNLKPGQQIYHRVFAPSELLLSADLFLFATNNKFDYNSDFKNTFAYTFCGACNSKFQRLRSKDKKVQTGNKNDKPERLEVEDNLSSEEENSVKGDSIEEKDSIDEGSVDENSIDEDSINEDSINEEEDSVEEDEEDVIEEVKIQLIVKNKNIKIPTAKSLTIQPVNYENFVERINLIVQKILGKKITSKDYIVSYKAMNARGPSNELEDELDFQEFINEYKKIVWADKKMAVIVIVKDNIMKKKNLVNKYQKVFFFYIL